MAKGRISPQTHRLHEKNRLREAARRRAEALAARKAAKGGASPASLASPVPEPTVDPVSASTS